MFLLVPAAGFAQGSMDFGVEDVDEDSEETSDDGGGDGEMTFGAEEVENDESTDAAVADETYTVAVVAVPSEALDRSQRIELQDKMLEAVSLDPNYQPQDGAPVLSGLEEMGMKSCVGEPLCLAGVGQEAGVQRILMARVEKKGGGLSLNVDLFDTTDKLFVKYTTVDRLANYDAVVDAVEPAMKDIFDIRVERKGPNYGDEGDTGTVQKVLAYGTAGLAVASLGAGVYFGLQASDGEEAILGKKEGDKFTITQVEAESMLRDVENDALTANIFYGAAVGLGVVSGILFYVKSGSDVAGPEDRRRVDLIDRIDVTPTVGFGKVGLGASINF